MFLRDCLRRWYKLIRISLSVARDVRASQSIGYAQQFSDWVLYALFERIIPYEYYEFRLFETHWRSFHSRPTHVGKRQLDRLVSLTVLVHREMDFCLPQIRHYTALVTAACVGTSVCLTTESKLA